MDENINYEEIEKRLKEAVSDIIKLKKELLSGEKKIISDANFEGLKVAGRIANATLIVKEYPTCLENKAPAMAGKVKKAIDTLLKEIVVDTHNLKLELPEFSATLNNDHIEDESERLRLSEEKRLTERSALIVKDKANMFTFKTDQPCPSQFSYIPDKSFLQGCKCVLHPSYYDLFSEYHLFNIDEVKVTTMNRVINVYSNERMNEALMFMINHYCKRSYNTEAFKIPKVIPKLILLGSPDVDDDEESESKVEPINVDSVFQNQSFIEHFHKYRMNCDVKELTEYVVNNFDEMCSYNFNRSGFKNTINFDNNRIRIKEIILDYCEIKKINISDLFKHYSTIALDELVKTYIFTFSRYYELYHTEKIPDDLFVIKADKSKKNDSPKNKR